MANISFAHDDYVDQILDRCRRCRCWVRKGCFCTYSLDWAASGLLFGETLFIIGHTASFRFDSESPNRNPISWNCIILRPYRWPDLASCQFFCGHGTQRVLKYAPRASIFAPMPRGRVGSGIPARFWDFSKKVTGSLGKFSKKKKTLVWADHLYCSPNHLPLIFQIISQDNL